jgi:hypothetical protein
MGESSTHTEFVRELVSWISKRNSENKLSMIYADLPEAPAANKPPSIGGFIPDVYSTSGDGRPYFIGEAKTAKGLDTGHSRRQISAYLRFLATQNAAGLVIAVPWQCVPAARSLVRALQRVDGTASVRTYFLEQLSG